METVATLEKVKAAFDQLCAMNEKPSAAKIVAMVGGSKSTVLAHMRTILEDFAKTKGPFDPARDLLESTASVMVRRLWEEANRLAECSFENRLKTLLGIQAGLFEDARSAIEAEELAIARMEAAEKKVADLEAELSARVTADHNLDTLKSLLETLRKKPEVPAMTKMLSMLADGKRHDKEGIYERMIAMGYEPAIVHRARYHAVVEGKYIDELDENDDLNAGLKLTAKGSLKAKG